MTVTLLYVQDALRAKNCSTYGYKRETTPYLSQVADDGIKYTGISPSTWTKPVAASILSGCRPFTHNTYYRDNKFDSYPCTLPETLSDDIDTAAVVSNGYTSAEFGFHESFDIFKQVYNSADDWIAPPDDMTEDIRSIIESDERKDDIFLLVWSIGPHLPYNTAEPRWGERDIANSKGNIKGKIEEHGRDAIINRYDDQVFENDRHLGEVISILKENNEYEDSCLIVAGDHGEGFGEGFESLGAKAYGHGKVIPYRAISDVPLIVKPPSCESNPQNGSKLASLIDIFPTVCNIYDEKVPTIVQGNDLLSENFERKKCYIQAPGADRQGDQYLAVRTEDWKFIIVRNENGFFEGMKKGIKSYIKTGVLLGEYLLPIENNSEIMINRTKEQANVTSELRDSILTVIEMDRNKSEGHDEVIDELSQETEDQLRELGYL
ncbi:MAG: sulfatase-like hydrolase/transferase [Halobacteriaceae archaeon]